MKLSYLIKACTPVWLRSIEPATNPKADPDILSIHSDAGKVRPGGLFIAIKGFKADGHDFIEQAIENGAAAVITQKHLHCPVASVEVKDTRKAMASIAATFYGNPSEDISLTGITGTNGKTTTAWLLESILKHAGHITGVIGTVNWRYKDKIFDAPVTTPESIDLQHILSVMKQNGVTHVIMEVSSHAIDLNRIRECAFDAGIFTNLTQDHLDYHKTMSAYFKCKKIFFTKFLMHSSKAGHAAAIINIDDEKGKKIQKALKCPILTTSKAAGSDIFSTDIKDDISGIQGILHIAGTPMKFSSSLTGTFNLENILSAAGGAHALNVTPEAIIKGINACKGVPGRLERIENSWGHHIFVDYAHTPNALESILKNLKSRAPKRLISVFGCGGDRDRSKRPVMGEIGAKYSDTAIITSDNPRTEEPMAIIQDILKGVPGSTPAKIIVEPDRKAALEKAVELSRPGDIVVAAGKGHETYQVTNAGTIEFDDRVILRRAMTNMGFRVRYIHRDILRGIK